MITDDPTSMSILRAVYEAAMGCSGAVVRRSAVLRLTPIDPASVQGAIRALTDAGMIAPAVTEDRICLTRAGQICARGMTATGLPIS